MNPAGLLLRPARLSTDVMVAAPGSPKKVTRRGKNTLVQRLLARGRVFGLWW